MFKNSIESIISENKYWCYMMNVDPGNPLKNLIEVQKRAHNEADGLRITRLEGDTDVFNSGLNPRAELVPGLRFPYRQETHIHLEIFFDDETFNSTFFQLMGKNNSNQTKPIIALDVKGGNVHARIIEFDNGEQFVRHVIAKYSDVYRKEVVFDIYASPNKNSGYFKVFLNNKSVFERTGKQTYWKNAPENSQSQVQYGCYGTDGSTSRETLRYHHILVEKNNSVPEPEPEPDPKPKPKPEPEPEPEPEPKPKPEPEPDPKPEPEPEPEPEPKPHNIFFPMSSVKLLTIQNGFLRIVLNK
jgi:hypothetical protein